MEHEFKRDLHLPSPAGLSRRSGGPSQAADNGFLRSSACSIVPGPPAPIPRPHQGGIAGRARPTRPWAEGDSPDVHFADTVKGSDWGCDQEVARLFVNAAPIAMRQMAFWGVPWNRVVPGEQTYYKGGKPFTAYEKPENAGLIHSRNFGGTAKWRTCYTSDGTGHCVLYTLDNRAAQMGVNVVDKVEAIALIHDGSTCMGAIARCLKTGELTAYLARATLIATGGFGRIYRESTNAVICDGGGLICALDTGVVPLGNMEAVQFHPTGIVPTDILVTEGCRGDGGTLLDKNEYRFMPDYEPEKAELASRDVVSRRMTEHMRKGLGVPSPYGDHLWLDIRHLGEQHIRHKLREVDEICQSFLGIDPVHQLIPVRPTQHYSMGGVRTNKDGAAYGLKGLFSAGESACWDMHGFNRGTPTRRLCDPCRFGFPAKRGGRLAHAAGRRSARAPRSLIRGTCTRPLPRPDPGPEVLALSKASGGQLPRFPLACPLAGAPSGERAPRKPDWSGRSRQVVGPGAEAVWAKVWSFGYTHTCGWWTGGRFARVSLLWRRGRFLRTLSLLPRTHAGWRAMGKPGKQLGVLCRLWFGVLRPKRRRSTLDDRRLGPRGWPADRDEVPALACTTR